MTHDFPQWARDVLEWGEPWMQASVLGLLTWVQEDVPAFIAALWSSAGRIHPVLAFLGIFLGIWLGDLLLYGWARFFGRPVLTSHWVSRWIHPDQVRKSEDWFHQKGMGVLFMSRFIPGTRLPTYLAAGLLKLPLLRFVMVTGIAVFLWTMILFVLARFWGESVLRGLRHPGHLALAGTLLILIVFRGAVWKFVSSHLLSWPVLHAWWGRWSRWEFWPAWLFYLPVSACYLWLSIRYRGWTLPTAANPGIATGGMVGESKFETLRVLQEISPESTATCWLIPPISARFSMRERMAELDRILTESGMSFPIIMKPDVGQRGVGVKCIRHRTEAVAYLKNTPAALLVQRYIAGPHEIGLFYYRFPGQGRGQVFAVTEKIFPHVTGDGIRTIQQLIWDDSRARCIAATYEKRFAERLQEIPAEGREVRLVEAGNHAQGCIFRDGRHLLSDTLLQKMDAIASRVDGFYIGRFDIRYESSEALKEGRQFWILELNGAASEATSIYDERNSLVSAYRTLFRQWELVFQIGDVQRRLGVKAMSLPGLWASWRRTQRLIATYPVAD